MSNVIELFSVADKDGSEEMASDLVNAAADFIIKRVDPMPGETDFTVQLSVYMMLAMCALWEIREITECPSSGIVELVKSGVEGWDDGEGAA